MKDMFRGFYGISIEDLAKLWKDDKTSFVFDTNALLLLYRCESQTREDFFKVWEQIKDKVWLPYHVCLEFQRNRLNAIKTHVTELENFGKNYKERLIKAAPLENSEKNIVKRYASLEDEFNKMSGKLTGVVESFIKESLNSRISEADFLKNHDIIRDRISNLIGDKIGQAPSASEVLTIESMGAERYKDKIPPGYMDEKDKKDITYNYNGSRYESKYGDWMIWNEVLNYAKKEGLKSIVFVSNDLKEDWVFKIGGRIRGPLEHLKTELFNFSGAENLQLYSSPSFLSAANDYLDGDKASSDSIKEMEDLTKTYIIDKSVLLKRHKAYRNYPRNHYSRFVSSELDNNLHQGYLNRLLDNSNLKRIEIENQIEELFKHIETLDDLSGTKGFNETKIKVLQNILAKTNSEIDIINLTIKELKKK